MLHIFHLFCYVAIESIMTVCLGGNCKTRIFQIFLILLPSDEPSRYKEKAATTVVVKSIDLKLSRFLN